MDEKPWPPEPEFPERLFGLRRARRVKNDAIAAATGVSVKTVSHWIGGQQPEPDALLRLADYFDVTPEYLLRGTLPEQPAEDAPREREYPPLPIGPQIKPKGSKKPKQA